MKVPTWAWVTWAVGGLLLETWALVNGLAGDTLTEVILRSIPGWLIYGVIGWMAWHFRKAR